ncbi:MAG: tRNA (cytidine(56)-2'-O)-methyltransferase [Candidatus Caldarchaeum sp.]
MLAVLRLSHRIERDKRLTSHVALVARAFGADKMYYTGDRDENVELTVKKVNEKWGGTFEVEYVTSWRMLLKSWKGCIVHLTMYGMPLKTVIQEIRKTYAEKKKLMVVVGGEKVEAEVFHVADYNVSITNQPHSEAAALAVFLDWLFEGTELERTFPDALIQVIPSPKGKIVQRRNGFIET